MTAELAGAKQRLDYAYSLVSQLRLDEEIMAHWAKYLCVLTSGFVESALKSLIADYTSRKAHKPISDFVESRLSKITNLNEERLCQLLGAFDKRWSDEFLRHRSDEQKAALDSVVAMRNHIAHGRSVGVTVARMKNYYRGILGAIDIIDQKCIGQR